MYWLRLGCVIPHPSDRGGELMLPSLHTFLTEYRRAIHCDKSLILTFFQQCHIIQMLLYLHIPRQLGAEIDGGLVGVLRWREEDRRLVDVDHGVKVGSFVRSVVQLVC